MADNRKLMAGILNLPESARKDLAQRAQDVEREGVVGMLRKAGGEMYNNPIVNTAVGLSPVLGDIQAGVEAYRSAQAGDWGNAGLNAAGMLPFIPMLGKTVWHGSPHAFDKFDLSKIGTGEGAQAYGHGLYLAESPDVATEYSKMEGMVQPPPRRMFQGAELTPGTPEYHAGTLLERTTLPAARKEVAGWIKEAETWPEARKADPREMDVLAGWQKTLDTLNQTAKKSDFSIAPGGNLYKVDIPDEQIAKMLDWDKPLSEQPQAVQDALHQAALVNFETNIGPKASGEIGDLGWTKNVKSMSGEDLYRKLTEGAFTNEMFLQGAKKGEAQAVISEKLKQAGIPGIQYLDQASRGAGDGTRNYVVFSDEIPQILERNNVPVNK